MPLFRQRLVIEPLIALFTTIGFGYLVGKIRIGKFTRQMPDEYYDDSQHKTPPTPRSSK